MTFVPSHMRMKSLQQTQQQSNEVQVTEHSQQQVVEQPAINNQDLQDNSYDTRTISKTL